MLIASYVRREAVLSSRIEGTRASLCDLMADEAGKPPHAPPDDVREVRNYVAALDFGIERLHSPPQEMHDTLAAWETFVHARGELPDLIQCALMHEHFEAIHPFLDGNGRVGRLLITLFLIERGRLSQPLLYLSEYIERHRDHYYRGLMRIRTHGDWHGWLH